MSDRRLAQRSIRRAALRAAPSLLRASAKNGRKDVVDLGVLGDHLGYFIRRLQIWVFQDFIRALAPIDIRPAQYSVLVVIAANPGLSQSDLAATLAIERARLVRLLDKLEKRGLTRRLNSRTDRRTHALQLTNRGHNVLRRAKALAAAHEARLTAALGDEQRRLMIGALKRLDR
jgi:DNA-binding MarR family transcriptional regulator